MSDEKKSEFVWNVHSYINEYIRFADTKAEIVIVWDTAVVGGMIAVKVPTLFNDSPLGIAAVSAFVLLGISFLIAAWTVLPRLPSSPGTGYVFWGKILAHKSRDKFLSEFRNAKPETLDDEATQHLYDLSIVSDKKYRRVWWCIVFAALGTVVSGVVYALGKGQLPAAP